MHGTHHIDELQGYAKWMGRLFTLIAAAMTFTFGFALGGDSVLASYLIGIGLAAVTVLVAILLNFVDVAWRQGAKPVAIGLAAFWIVCVGAEYFSHVGFTVGHRSSDVQNATLQDSKHGNAAANVQDIAARLNQLRAKYDWQKSYDPPGAYDARIDTVSRKADLEASRKGCKDKCLTLRAELASLKAEQAIAADRLAVQEEIKATESQLIAARKTANTTAKGDSHVFSQTAMTATLFTGSLKPTEASLQWASMGIGAFISLVFTFASAACNFIAFRDWTGNGVIQAPKHRNPSLHHQPVHPRDEERSASTGNSHAHEITEGTGYLRPSVGRGTHTHETVGSGGAHPGNASTTLNMFGLGNSDEVLARWFKDLKAKGMIGTDGGNLLKAA